MVPARVLLEIGRTAMLVLFLCHCLAMSSGGGQPPTPATQASSVSERTEQRSYHEISRDMRLLLKREATADDESAHRAVIVALVNLYGEIMRDGRLAESDTLQSYRVKIRSRLLKSQKDIERILARRQQDATQPLIDDHEQVTPMIASNISLHLALLASSSGRDGLSTLGAGGFGWFGGAPRRDYGPDLVALIQRTISPKSWDVNGGAGTIYYYWPWYALVVRNTAEVHRQIGGLRNGL
jgi:hypothetical protein